MEDKKADRVAEERLDPEDQDAVWEGAASENAYPEDLMIDLGGGREMSMNDAARAYNRIHGKVDKYAHISHEDQIAAMKREKAAKAKE